jgi:HD-GYP domain-containing protein (c-di-GMP phosphodiesterase class II)
MRFSPKPTIAFKLTVMFTLFGMIIGYFSFIMSNIGSTRNLMNLTTTVLHKQFYESLSANEPDSLLNLLKKNDQSIIKIMNIVKNDPMHPVTTATIYIYDSSKNEWFQHSINDDGKIRKTDFDGNIKNLNRALSRKFYVTDSQPFFGQNEKINLYVNITRNIDLNKYLIGVEFTRKGLYSSIVQNTEQFIFFEIALLLMSIILGKFFARRIVKPIKKISAESARIASGNFSYRFDIKRKDEIGVLADSLNKMASQIENTINEIDNRVRTMETMNRIDKAVLSSISRNDLLDRVVGIVATQFNNSSIAIALKNEEKKGFEILSIFEEGNKALLSERPFIADADIDPELLSRTAAVYQYTGENMENSLVSLIQGLVNYKPGAILHVPIYIKEKYLGSLFLVKIDEEPYIARDVESVSMLADQVGVALQSVKAFEEKESLFIGILMALTNAVDAKSKWTAGHSSRVAKYSELIGLQLKFNELELRDLSLSAILHDIGKIGVPEFILDKPEKLSDSEYETIKHHPTEGAKIIGVIPSHESILAGILYHHEQWDGNGYPSGLKSYDIPLQSRIITVADIYDAITAERPYRNGMGKEKALEFMIENSGRIFDPELVEIFLKILFEEKDEEKND